ncbi:hypothetical protein, partial [Treponema endosymbiont of Eucomonympha sp.]|uniref:hypothetical protein n=1 Tax=Treponema endosymbiont of Eucomonympha sp. TaxID=1580831 RepID=UPI000A930368
MSSFFKKLERCPKGQRRFPYETRKGTGKARSLPLHFGSPSRRLPLRYAYLPFACPPYVPDARGFAKQTRQCAFIHTAGGSLKELGRKPAARSSAPLPILPSSLKELGRKPAARSSAPLPILPSSLKELGRKPAARSSAP